MNLHELVIKFRYRRSLLPFWEKVHIAIVQYGDEGKYYRS